MEATILTVRDLVSSKELRIPDYQRPYRWTQHHVQQLFSDIQMHKDKSAYRLGTIVLHRNGGHRDIVDGQQRTITLLLTVRALINQVDQGKTDHLKGVELPPDKDLPNPSFDNQDSQYNIHQNYLEIERIVSRPSFDKTMVTFFLDKCEVVLITLNELSQAFQFFDSQNARGKDLVPHDLLKAYHLRGFPADEIEQQAICVSSWENCENTFLSHLFSDYLYRIRQWSTHRSARHFSKAEIGIFKGIDIDTSEYPLSEPQRIVHRFVDHYNQQYERGVDQQHLDFPFQLDQPIINGRRFFEWAAYYEKHIRKAKKDSERLRELLDESDNNRRAISILDILAQNKESKKDYLGQNRTGDKFVRMLFDCLQVYYTDRFGDAHVALMVEKVFVYAYSLRLTNSRISLASVDKYVLANNLFAQLREAAHPNDFLSYTPAVLIEKDIKGNQEKVTGLIKLFKEMKYFEHNN